MKKWSIKFKIIFWYTIFFALLIITNLYFLNASASSVLTSRAETELTNATIEVADYIKFEDDGVYLDEEEDNERFSFYHDGVEFLLYQNDLLAYGSVPNNFDSTSKIMINEVQKVEKNSMSWLIYDIVIEDGYILRGIYNLNEMMNSINQVILIAGILSPIIILISSIGGLVIIKRSFRPIQNIYKTAASIKNEEDFSKRIVTNSSKDEVYALADMVNQMLDQVEQSLNREKQFSANVSHELRTPLAVMQAQAEYLLANSSTEKDKHDISTIIQQISYMENIVTQLLEITRTRQLSSDDMEEINILELIQLTTESFSKQLEAKGITLTISNPTVETLVTGNQTMMIRVFSNLIANSIKYNKVNGLINVSFSESNQFLVVNVKDNGIGIPKEHISRIFDPFYQSDEARSQNKFSFGLGLALVKEIVKIHGGDIQVESEEHEGTTFEVFLPFNIS